MVRDEQVAAQLQAAHQAGLSVILCVGEALADREGWAGRRYCNATIIRGLAKCYKMGLCDYCL